MHRQLNALPKVVSPPHQTHVSPSLLASKKAPASVMQVLQNCHMA